MFLPSLAATEEQGPPPPGDLLSGCVFQQPTHGQRPRPSTTFKSWMFDVRERKNLIAEMLLHTFPPKHALLWRGRHRGAIRRERYINGWSIRSMETVKLFFTGIIRPFFCVVSIALRFPTGDVIVWSHLRSDSADETLDQRKQGRGRPF